MQVSFIMQAIMDSPIMPVIKLESLDMSKIDWMFVKEIFTVSAFTLIMMTALELLTWNDEWKQKFKKKEIKALYFEAWKVNLIHYVVLGPIAYAGAVIIHHRLTETSPWIGVPGLFLSQSVGYALCHAWMHDPIRYAKIHKYHHTFSEKTFVRPVSANATTTAEFIVAYITPIVTGIVVFRPPYMAIWCLVSSLSVINLLIHTDTAVLPMGWLPDFFVTNQKHFFHHEKNVRKHYSAPLFDLDHLLGLSKDKN